MGVVKKQTARKDYKCRFGCEIQRGEEYYRARKKFQRARFGCLKHPFRPSELATSGKIADLLGIQEDIQDIEITPDNLEDLVSALNDGAERARTVGEEYEESASNMEEYFPSSSQVDEIREKSENCDAWAEELEEAASNIEELQSEIEELQQEKDKLKAEVDLAEETPEEPPERLTEIEGEIESKLDEARSHIDDAISELGI